ncbi:hypothetical protein BG003_010691 [Podila horticola]|nr:hypothetical protein BG003_010691 [Podila horticola]
MNAVTNPMELFHIVQRVGWFLPLWTIGQTSIYKDDFQPRDLVSCIKTCRLWRDTLTPILWLVYDDNYMRCSGTYAPFFGVCEGIRIIPLDVMHAHSHLLRFVKLWASWPAGNLAPTRLKEIDIAGDALRWNSDILFANPQVSDLSVALDDGHLFSHVQRAIESMSRLKTLSLDYVHIDSPDQLCDVLNNNNTGLQELHFRHPIGISGFDGCGPLMSMRRIRFYGVWRDNLGLVELIRLCPNLEELEMPGWGCPVDEITKNIRDCCSRLTSIKYWNGDLAEAETLLLIEATPRLMNFHAFVHSFSTKVCDALMVHTDWLEGLSLLFYDDLKAGVEGINRILATCSNLRLLEICFIGDTKSQECAPPSLWTKDPWKCVKLETLYLTGLVMNPISGSAVDRRRHSDLEAKLLKASASHGWSVAMTPDPADGVQMLGAVLCFEILRCVWDMECMRRVHVEGFEYVHKDRMSRDQR